LIKSFEEFAEWLDTAAVNPAGKTSFWKKLFGTQPKRPPFNRKEASGLSSKLRRKVTELNQQLHIADNIDTQRTTKNDREEADQGEIGIQIGSNRLGVSSKLADSAKTNTSEVSLPRSGRVPKAEIYSSKSGKGLAWQRSKKFTRENSKTRQCSWPRPAANPLHR
jgi:hypothetical protein